MVLLEFHLKQRVGKGEPTEELVYIMYIPLFGFLKIYIILFLHLTVVGLCCSSRAFSVCSGQAPRGGAGFSLVSDHGLLWGTRAPVAVVCGV